VSLIFHERLGHEGRRPSPFSWRIRYALAHKGLEAEVRPTRFADVEAIEALSGQRFVPVLEHDGRVVADSWAIACHLEDAFPDRPSLFGGAAGRALARFVNSWTDQVLIGSMRRVIVPEFLDCLDAGDRAYFRSSREAQHGCTLEALAARRPELEAEVAAALGPLRTLLTAQPYLCGEAPAYADYTAFSAFQYLRLGRPDDLLRPDDPVHAWRGRLIGMFDNLGERFPKHPRA